MLVECSIFYNVCTHATCMHGHTQVMFKYYSLLHQQWCCLCQLFSLIINVLQHVPLLMNPVAIFGREYSRTYMQLKTNSLRNWSLVGRTHIPQLPLDPFVQTGDLLHAAYIFLIMLFRTSRHVCWMEIAQNSQGGMDMNSTGYHLPHPNVALFDSFRNKSMLAYKVVIGSMIYGLLVPF